eukprot:6209303-Pleurochrysis_carterae.AAC.1
MRNAAKKSLFCTRICVISMPNKRFVISFSRWEATGRDGKPLDSRAAFALSGDLYVSRRRLCRAGAR